MRLKPRTIPVIALSSLIIASVLALTIFGFYAYLEWKETNIRRNYKLLLQELNGQLFDKDITVDIQAKIERDGVFKEKPIVWGTIENKTNKKIYSLRMKIAFSNPKQQVVYVDTFYPITSELKSGSSTSFTHQLKNCPSEVLDYLKSKLKFAKVAEPLQLVYKVEDLDIR